MEEKLKVSPSQRQTVEAGVSRAHAQSAAEAVQSSGRSSNEERKLKTDLALDVNELQESSGEVLEALARNLDVYLHPARSRHQHIFDIIRAALASGATVTAEGFLDQVGDSFAMLRWPKLNFLPVPEDVCVSLSAGEKHPDVDLDREGAGVANPKDQRERRNEQAGSPSRCQSLDELPTK